MKKLRFELTTKTKDYYGRKLFQIRALIEFGNIKKGELGGFIEKESNLEQEGTGWLYPDAIAMDYATIRGGDIRGGDIRGGTIWGGDIRGGTIWGGDIMGGTIRGGDIRGGDIRGGDIRGGDIWGGTIWGGTIWGGDIWGGTIWGGDIRGGDIRGGTIRGGDIVKDSPIYIGGLQWNITIKSTHITIGCEHHTHKEWDKFSDKRILEMAGKDALKFWKSHKKTIIQFAKEQAKIK